MAVVVGGDIARAQTTERVSLGSGGTQGNGDSGWSSNSDDGRFVAFASDASNLVAGDTNGAQDVFVRDLWLGTTERLSVSTGGAQANSYSTNPVISPDGRFVAFESLASSLVAGDTNGAVDVFVRDRQLGTTERVSLSAVGVQGNGYSRWPSISADGRFVAFFALATNLVAGDTNGTLDVFVRDRQLATTERVSVDSGGAQGNGVSEVCFISADGRFVGFISLATNLVAGDTNGFQDTFVRDRQLGTTERVSVDAGGMQSNGNSDYPWLSADGRFVAFHSPATNLVTGDTNGARDIFVRDRQSGTTELVSVHTSGAQGNGDSLYPSISADGRFVAFGSHAANLVAGDTNGFEDVFVRDRQSGTTERVSVDTSGTQANAASGLYPSISGDGRFVAFYSLATNLVAGDTNGSWDSFERDRYAASGTAVCFGDGTGTSCPCLNDGGAGQGCANGTGGGGVLSASGSASITADSMTLLADGVINNNGLFFQGNNTIGGGAGTVFGDGIRCCGGGVVRIQVVNPPGSTSPATAQMTETATTNGPAGTITAGTKKCYQYWYRDPATSPCGAQFNLTNAVTVTWQP